MITEGRRAPSAREPRNVAPDGRPLEEQPRWRRDFPIEWPEDEAVSRRELVKFIVLTSAAFAVGQAWIVLKSFARGLSRAAPDGVKIATVDELPVGSAKVFEYPHGSSPRLLVRTGEATFVAYDQQCTHLQCPVLPKVAEGKLHCPCHNGWFDLSTGRPIAGPPRRPLPKVQVEVKDGAVYATGVTEGNA